MSSWGKFWDKVEGVYDDLVGDNTEAAQAAVKQGEASLQIQRDQAKLLQERYDRYYAPIEQDLHRELRQGPDLEGEGARARTTFAQDYDRSLDESRRQQRRYGLDPTSTQAARFEEDAAYNKAAGLSLAENQARTVEDDRHFARGLSFLGGGSGLPGQVAQINSSAAQQSFGLASDYANQAAQGGQLLGTAFELGANYLTGGGYGLAKTGVGLAKDAWNSNGLRDAPDKGYGPKKPGDHHP